MPTRDVNLGDHTLLKGGEGCSGGYRVLHLGWGRGATLYIRHNCRDARIAEFMQDSHVRIALNLAMNRVEVNYIVYDGTATRRQASPHYHEGAASGHIAYDPDRANVEPDEAKRLDLVRQMFGIWAEEVPVVGLLGDYRAWQ